MLLDFLHIFCLFCFHPLVCKSYKLCLSLNICMLCSGELKRVLAKVTSLEPQDQRLLFRGKEKDNEEFLHIAGVKDTSKVVLLEDPASKERKLEQMKMDMEVSKACEAVVLVRSEVDKLAMKVGICRNSNSRRRR